MASNFITNNELRGKKVISGKKGASHIGKVRRMVFHPRERRVIGFLVKRPDLAWMFHRKDLFVQIQGFDLVDGEVVIRNTPDATDSAACKALGVNWDTCVMWEGLPLMTESGEVLGMVGTVTFDRETGAISTVLADAGATANALLGKRTIPASYIKGFRRGIGVQLAPAGDPSAEQDEEDVELGAILVSDKALDLPVEGGAAEKAGAATAIAMNKVSTSVKPAVANAAKKTTSAASKGAKAVSKRALETKDAFVGLKEEYQKEMGTNNAAAKEKKTAGDFVSSRKKMFSQFKEEFDKARRGDE